MSPEDELGRDIPDDERKLAREILALDNREPYEQLRAVKAGEQAGLHPERVRQITRTWSNDGIVSLGHNANLVTITTYGYRVLPEVSN